MENKHVFQSTVDPYTASHHCYDVLVVGAGPAGSSAAYHLACRGVDVLLVERSAFPRDKRCGDAILPPALEELALMGMPTKFNLVTLWLGISACRSMVCL
jgi:glycine/D-amino acid oxidase-like deaminating enzyme